MTNFDLFWKAQNEPEALMQKHIGKSSSKLTRKELKELQDIVDRMQGDKKSSSQIIKYLQKWNSKLAEKYQAERALSTESKRLDTSNTINAAKYLDTDKFKCLLSPNACPICRKKTEDGNKVFTTKELQKDGFGHKPPFHPNCYCILLPQGE